MSFTSMKPETTNFDTAPDVRQEKRCGVPKIIRVGQAGAAVMYVWYDVGGVAWPEPELCLTSDAWTASHI